MSNKAYIGIDPGKSGGIAIISQYGEPSAWPMPETVRDVWDTVSALAKWKDVYVSAALEVVHSSPQMGVKSSFTFGHGYGLLEMALTAAGIPWRRVRPREWQAAIGVAKTKGNFEDGRNATEAKNKTKAAAQQLFPSLKVTHAISDALLIAEWLRRQP